MNEAERFFAKIDRPTTTTCWLWTAGKTKDGYGVFSSQGARILAHRWTYLRFVGPVPLGLEIDHLCHVTSCVNPDHLEAVTHSVNILRSTGPDAQRARHAAQTHCKHGHEFTEDNTYRAAGRRHCRTCVRAAKTRFRARKKAT